MTASDVDHGAVAREVVSRDDVGTLIDTAGRHGVVEDLCELRVVGEMVEEGSAERVVERGLSGSHAMAEIVPTTPDDLTAVPPNVRHDAVGRVGL